MAERLLEAAAPADFLSRVQALDFGEVAALAGGVSVKKLKTEDDREGYRIGRPSTYRSEPYFDGQLYRTAEEAVQQAFRLSAESTDPESIGGATRLGRWTQALHGGTVVRIVGYTTEGKAIVEPLRPAEEPIPLASAPRRVVDPGNLTARVREEALEERETGKPGTNFTQVSPEDRKRVEPLVRHYMKQAHPFTACVRDNTKRFGEERAKRICAVVKDMGAGTTKWRKGGASLKEVADATDALIEAAGGVEEAETVMLQYIVQEDTVDRLGNRHDRIGRFTEKSPGPSQSAVRARLSGIDWNLVGSTAKGDLVRVRQQAIDLMPDFPDDSPEGKELRRIQAEAERGLSTKAPFKEGPNLVRSSAPFKVGHNLKRRS